MHTDRFIRVQRTFYKNENQLVLSKTLFSYLADERIAKLSCIHGHELKRKGSQLCSCFVTYMHMSRCRITSRTPLWLLTHPSQANESNILYRSQFPMSLACEQQTYFRSSLPFLRKITRRVKLGTWAEKTGCSRRLQCPQRPKEFVTAQELFSNPHKSDHWTNNSLLCSCTIQLRILLSNLVPLHHKRYWKVGEGPKKGN